MWWRCTRRPVKRARCTATRRQARLAASQITASRRVPSRWWCRLMHQLCCTTRASRHLRSSDVSCLWLVVRVLPRGLTLAHRYRRDRWRDSDHPAGATDIGTRAGDNPTSGCYCSQPVDARLRWCDFVFVLLLCHRELTLGAGVETSAPATATGTGSATGGQTPISPSPESTPGVSQSNRIVMQNSPKKRMCLPFYLSHWACHSLRVFVIIGQAPTTTATATTQPISPLVPNTTTLAPEPTVRPGFESGSGSTYRCSTSTRAEQLMDLCLFTLARENLVPSEVCTGTGGPGIFTPVGSARFYMACGVAQVCHQLSAYCSRLLNVFVVLCALARVCSTMLGAPLILTLSRWRRTTRPASASHRRRARRPTSKWP